MVLKISLINKTFHCWQIEVEEHSSGHDTKTNQFRVESRCHTSHALLLSNKSMPCCVLFFTKHLNDMIWLHIIKSMINGIIIAGKNMVMWQQ